MLENPITTLKGIGPRRAEAFGKLGLTCLYDLLRFMPRDYIDCSRPIPVSDMVDGSPCLLHLEVVGNDKIVRTKTGTMLLVEAQDSSGRLKLCLFNQAYRYGKLNKGSSAYFYGKADLKHGKKLISPIMFSQIPGVIPVYPTTNGLSQKVIRSAVRTALDSVDHIYDTLPVSIKERFSICELDFAIKNIHFPMDMDSLESARHRLVFEDMLAYTLMLNLFKKSTRQNKGIRFDVREMFEAFSKLLTFNLTKAQARVMREIEADMRAEAPMNRLLQGDVGSGKTVIALYAMFIAVHNGYQAALMAPTEILAQQHYQSLKNIFGGNACMLIGSQPQAERKQIIAGIERGEYTAITGTHALLQESVGFNNLGVVIADEQHRFGVEQRAAIGHKGIAPDYLIMSATPIPRTLALMIYGDLNVSIVDELPPGRQPVDTRFVPENRRAAMYRFIEERLKRGEQAYVVCPSIDPVEGIGNIRSATEVFYELYDKLSVRTALLHGRMRPREKDEVVERFRKGDIDLIVSTTVIEVGVDVPNATIMVIENADRFGLAQLHQLRGRVGRGGQASFCFLLAQSNGANIKERLSVLQNSNDGFEIARKDLELRGPGEFLGTRQHGMDEFAATCLAGDMCVLEDAVIASDMIMSDKALQMVCGDIITRANKILSKKLNEIALN